MGIHIHNRSMPDSCCCCGVNEKLDALWDRSSGAVVSINGISPDGQGRITLELLQEAAVQGLIDDYISPMQDSIEDMQTTLSGYTQIFEDYANIKRAVSTTIPAEITDVFNYVSAVADDLAENYYNKTWIDTNLATQAQIAGLATRQDYLDAVSGYVTLRTPQEINRSAVKTIITGGTDAGRIIFKKSEAHNSDCGAIDFYYHDGIKRGAIFPQIYENNERLSFFTQDPDGTKHGVIIETDGTTEISNSSFGNSKAAVTKGFVASTDGTTNNLMHREGNETVLGDKTISGEWQFTFPPQARKDHLKLTNGWHPIYTESANIASIYRTTIIRFIDNDSVFIPLTLVARRRTATQNNFKIDKGDYAQYFRMTRKANGECTVWAKFTRAVFWIEADIQSTATAEMNSMRLDDRRSSVFDEPTVGEDYTVVLTPTEF